MQLVHYAEEVWRVYKSSDLSHRSALGSSDPLPSESEDLSLYFPISGLILLPF